MYSYDFAVTRKGTRVLHPDYGPGTVLHSRYCGGIVTVAVEYDKPLPPTFTAMRRNACGCPAWELQEDHHARLRRQIQLGQLSRDEALQLCQQIDPNGCWWYRGAPDDEAGADELTRQEACAELLALLDEE